MKGLRLILTSSLLIVLLYGCETLQQPEEEWPLQPDKSAVYRTANETYIVENTTPDEFSHEMIYDPDLKSGRYKDGETLTWTRK